MSGAASDLPYVDRHSVEVTAPVDSTWESTVRVVEGSFEPDAVSRIARVLGCEDYEASGSRPLATGSTVPGFHVEAARAPAELVLRGRHRFSEYALIFCIERLDGERTELRAETRARFPGAKGRVYRALVIGTRLHVLVTRRLLVTAARRAERFEVEATYGL